ncbi:hypothetical protein [Vibrio sp. HN007]|uniref:hypothetical protein n=1 Tax=Vibrio iocasae TaxID=3098914 RepID=UPI0035D457F9
MNRYIEYLNDVPEEMRLFIADVYTETMQRELVKLGCGPYIPEDTLGNIHRIKSSVSMAGFRHLYRKLLKIEKLGQQEDLSFATELTKLISDIEQSIQCLEKWKKK